MPYESAQNVEFLDFSENRVSRKYARKTFALFLKHVFAFLMWFGLNIDIFSVSKRLCIVFCIYEHIKKTYFWDLFEMFEKVEIHKTVLLLCLAQIEV